MLFTSFGLAGNPFDGAAAERADSTERVRKLRADLVGAIRAGRGVILVVGPAGVGKTSLLDSVARDLTDTMPGAAVLRLSCRMQFTAADLVRQVCASLDAASAGGHDGAAPVVLLIDDAHRLGAAGLRQFLHGLDPDRLATLRLRVVCFGEPPLRRHLVAALPREIRRRIATHHRLTPMSEPETKEFIGRRLTSRGGRAAIFDASAMRCIAARSQGIPGRVNALCAGALYAAFLRGEAAVTEAHAEQAALLLAGSGGTARPLESGRMAAANLDSPGGRPLKGHRAAPMPVPAATWRPSVSALQTGPAGAGDGVPGAARADTMDPAPAPASRPRSLLGRAIGPALNRPGYAALVTAIAAATLAGAMLGLFERRSPPEGRSSTDVASATWEPGNAGAERDAPIPAPTAPARGDPAAEWSAFDVAFADITASERTIREPVSPEPDVRGPSATRRAGIPPTFPIPPADASTPEAAAATARPVPPPLPAVRARTVWIVPPRKPRLLPADFAASRSDDCRWLMSKLLTDRDACRGSLRRIVAEDTHIPPPHGTALAAADPPPRAGRDRAGAGRD